MCNEFVRSSPYVFSRLEKEPPPPLPKKKESVIVVTVASSSSFSCFLFSFFPTFEVVWSRVFPDFTTHNKKSVCFIEEKDDNIKP